MLLVRMFCRNKVFLSFLTEKVRILEGGISRSHFLKQYKGLVLLPRDSRKLLNDVWPSLVLDVIFST